MSSLEDYIGKLSAQQLYTLHLASVGIRIFKDARTGAWHWMMRNGNLIFTIRPQTINALIQKDLALVGYDNHASVLKLTNKGIWIMQCYGILPMAAAYAGWGETFKNLALNLKIDIDGELPDESE